MNMREPWKNSGSKVISLPIQRPVCYTYHQHDLLNNYKLTKSDLFTWVSVASAEGVYMSILHGLLVGFLFPLMGWFFIRELPLPNFFDAEAEAQVELAGSGYGGGNANISGGDVGGDGDGGGDGGSGRQSGPRARAEGGGPIGRGNSTRGANLRQGEQNRDQDQREDRLNMRAQTASAPNANANANDELGRQVSARVAANFAVGGMTVPTMIFGKRMQVSPFLTFGTEKMVYV